MSVSAITEEWSEARHHISRQFNQDLRHLHRQVLSMSGLVQTQLSGALDALGSGDGELGERVVHGDIRINALEVEIDEYCVQILARRQPAASDLRLVVAVLKTITDLERIGDEAKRVARMGLHQIELGVAGTSYFDFRAFGRQVEDILQHALDAFARMDVAAALTALTEDEGLDRAYQALLQKLTADMMTHPDSIPAILDLLWAARALERIGDRSRNICEYVVYYVKGEDIRHIGAQHEALQNE